MSSEYLKRKKRFKKKRLILKNRFFWYFILIFILIALIFYFLFLSPVFKIEKVEIFVPKNIQETEIRSFINFEFEKPFLHFFKKNTFFLVSKKKVEKDILQRFPAVEQAKIKKVFPNTFSLTIEERKPKGVCCIGKVNCFLFDKSGIVFSGYFKKDGETNSALPIIFLKNKSNIKLGECVFSKEKIAQIFAIRKELLADNIGIENFEFAGGEKIVVKTKEGWKIYFSQNSIDSLNLALTKLNILLKDGLTEDERKNLEYIDLRFSKVFYRLKD